jgi:hypothetical protein
MRKLRSKFSMILFCLLIMGLQLLAQTLQPPTGGVFIPRNGSFEGRIGHSHVLFNSNDGGVMSVVAGEWPDIKTAAMLDMVFTIENKPSMNAIELHQSFDKNPKILFLEEGNDRIGIRVLFKLYGQDNVYHGHGMTETWLYPDGQIFISAAAMFENLADNEAVSAASINIDEFVSDPRNIKSSIQNLNDVSIPERYIMLNNADQSPELPVNLSLFWRTGRMEHDTYIYRSSFGLKGAPVFFRWPDYFRQAYTQLTQPDFSRKVQRFPWPPGNGVYIDEIISSQNITKLKWPVENKDTNPLNSFNALFRLAMGPDIKSVETFVSAEKYPISFTIQGGVLHGNAKLPDDKGYNDQEGCYEIRKVDSKIPLVITLPEDPMGRTIRVKVIALSGNGAVTTTIDGNSLVPQLSSDGGIADDPLAPIREQPEAAANAALITVKLTNKQQSLVVKEEEGIQLVYQTRDPSRNFAIYSTKSGSRWSSLRFSLIDGHARNMRAYGKQDWALTENLMHWFALMGYSPEQMLDQLRNFEVVKNGPEEIIFKYTSNNFNDGAQSEFIVRINNDSPFMKMNVKATFTVLSQWPYNSTQFFDAFPFRGVEPIDWWYDNVMHMSSDGKWQTSTTLDQTKKGDLDMHGIQGTTFISLYSSDRGNMMMLVKNLKPDLVTSHVICSNYIDLHMNVILNDSKLQHKKDYKDLKLSVEYELGIWGNETLTKDQLIEIGNKSIKAGTLVVPDIEY